MTYVAEIRSLEIVQSPFGEVKLHLEYKPDNLGKDIDKSEYRIQGNCCRSVTLISRGKLTMDKLAHIYRLLVLQIETVELVIRPDNMIAAVAMSSEYWTEWFTRQQLLASWQAMLKTYDVEGRYKNGLFVRRRIHRIADVTLHQTIYSK